MAVFTDNIRIRFAHTDPAGIVFYARYFEILNAVLEDWFHEGLDYNFDRLNFGDRIGIPMVHIHVDFLVPSRMGDLVTYYLSVAKLGRSSFTVNYEARVGEQVRMRAQAVHVFMPMGGNKTIPIPAVVRERMQKYLVETPDGAQK